MDNNIQIVIMRGQKPFMCRKFDYSEYWMSEEMEEIEIESYRPKITIDNPVVKKQERLPTFEEFIQRRKEGL